MRGFTASGLVLLATVLGASGTLTIPGKNDVQFDSSTSMSISFQWPSSTISGATITCFVDAFRDSSDTQANVYPPRINYPAVDAGQAQVKVFTASDQGNKFVFKTYCQSSAPMDISTVNQGTEVFLVYVPGPPSISAIMATSSGGLTIVIDAPSVDASTYNGTAYLTKYEVKYYSDSGLTKLRGETSFEISDDPSTPFDRSTPLTGTMSGVTPDDGTTLYFRVRAHNAWANAALVGGEVGEGDWSASVSHIQEFKPLAPSISSFTATSTTTATAVWTKDDDTGGSALIGYNVKLFKTAGGTTTVHSESVFNSSQTRIEFTGLLAGDSYKVEVKATNKLGDSPPDSLDLGILRWFADAVTAGNVIGVATDRNTIAVKWSKTTNSGGDPKPVEYIVTISEHKNFTAPKTNALTNVLETDFNGLTTGAYYYIKVEVKNFFGTQEPTNAVQFPFKLETAPDAPTGLTGTPESTTSIRLAWQSASNGGSPLTSLKVFRRLGTLDDGGGYGSLVHTITDSLSVTEYVMENFPAKIGSDNHDDKAWLFTIVAVNGEGPSLHSNEADVSLQYAPQPATSLKHKMLSSDKVQFSWKPPVDDGASTITKYELTVYKKLDATRSNVLDAGDIQNAFNSTSGLVTFTLKGDDNKPTLVAGTELDWTWMVKTFNSKGSSTVTSVPFRIFYSPTHVTNLIPTVTTSTSVLLSWGVPSDVGGSAVTNYDILYSKSIVLQTEPLIWANPGAEKSIPDFVGVEKYEISSLDRGESYTFVVRAQNEKGPGPWRQTLINIFFPPSAPVGLSWAPSSSTSFVLHWDNPDDKGGFPDWTWEVQYIVSNEKLEAVDWSKQNLFSPPTNVAPWNDKSSSTHTFTSFTTKNFYQARIRAVNNAVNNAGKGVWAEFPPLQLLYVPEAPTSPDSTVVDRERLTFNWVVPTDNGGLDLSESRICITDKKTDYLSVCTRATNTTNLYTITLDGFTPGITYYFWVQSGNRLGFGAPSVLSEGLLHESYPKAPAILKWIPTSSSSILIRWDLVHGDDMGGRNITHYLLDYSMSSKFAFDSACPGSNATSCQQLGLKIPSETYDPSSGKTTQSHIVPGLATKGFFYTRMKAVNAVGASTEYSDVTEGVELKWTPLKSINVEVHPASSSQLHIRWCDSLTLSGSHIWNYEIHISNSTGSHIKTVSTGDLGVASCKNFVAPASPGQLATAKTYKVKIRAINRALKPKGEWSVVASGLLEWVPDQPTQVEFYPTSSSTLRVKWEPPGDQTAGEGGLVLGNGGSQITGYIIDVYTNSTNSLSKNQTVASTEKNADVTLLAGLWYKIYVTAKNDVGYGGRVYTTDAHVVYYEAFTVEENENTVAVTNGLGLPSDKPDPVKLSWYPGPPSGIQATAVASNRMKIQISAGSDNGGENLLGYFLNYSVAGSPDTLLRVDVTASGSYTLTLLPGYIYNFAAFTINTVHTPRSDGISKTSKTRDNVPMNFLPTQVQGTDHILLSSTTLVLSWRPPTTPAEKGCNCSIANYTIHYGTASLDSKANRPDTILNETGMFDQVQIGNVTRNENKFSGLDPGMRYFFQVTALNGVGHQGNIDPNNWHSAPTVYAPRPVSNVYSTIQSKDTMRIYWTPPKSLEARGGLKLDQFVVTMRCDSFCNLTCGETVWMVPPDQAYFDFSGLTASRWYVFKVQATNRFGDKLLYSVATETMNKRQMFFTPEAPGHEYQVVTSSDSIYVSFNPGGTGGMEVDKYKVRAYAKGVLVSNTTASCRQMLRAGEPNTNWDGQNCKDGSVHTFFSDLRLKHKNDPFTFQVAAHNRYRWAEVKSSNDQDQEYSYSNVDPPAFVPKCHPTPVMSPSSSPDWDYSYINSDELYSYYGSDSGWSEFSVATSNVPLHFVPAAPTWPEHPIKITSSSSIELTWFDVEDWGGLDRQHWIVVWDTSQTVNDEPTEGARQLKLTQPYDSTFTWSEDDLPTDGETMNYFWVKAVNDKGASMLSESVSTVLVYAPDAPTVHHLAMPSQVDGPWFNAVVLTLTTHADTGHLNLTGFMMQWSLAETKSDAKNSFVNSEDSDILWVTADNNTEITYTLTDLTANVVGSIVHFQVRAFNDYGTSAWSESQSILVCVPPLKASSVTAVASLSTKFQVAWKTGTNGGCDVTGYTIVATVVTGTTSTSVKRVVKKQDESSSDDDFIDGLTPGEEYNIALYLTNSAGDSEAFHDYEWLYFPPVAPVSVKVAVADFNSLLVTWTQADTAEDLGGSTLSRYEIQISHTNSSDGIDVQVVSVPGTDRSYTANDLPNTISYTVKVRGRNLDAEKNNGWGEWSDPPYSKELLYPPDKPIIVSHTVLTSTSVRIEYNAPERNGGATISDYKVWLQDTDGSESDFACEEDTKEVKVCDVTGLIRGHTYSFQMYALNDVKHPNVSPKNGILSESFSHAILFVPSTPTSAKAEPALDDASMKIRWDEPEDLGGYSSIDNYQVQATKATFTSLPPSPDEANWENLYYNNSSVDPTATELTMNTTDGLGEHFYIRVRGINGQGEGDWSEDAVGPIPTITNVPWSRPDLSPFSPVWMVTRPDVPSNLLVQVHGEYPDLYFYANWSAPAYLGGSTLSGYRFKVVQLGKNRIDLPNNLGLIDARNNHEIKSMFFNNEDAKKQALSNGVEYGFILATKNVYIRDTFSKFTDEYSIYLAYEPNAPIMTKAENTDSTSMLVTWSTNGTNGSPITAFEVLWQLNSGGAKYASGSLTAGSTSATISGLGPAEVYNITVRAKNVVGWGEESATPLTAQAKFAPIKPLLVSAAASGYNEASVEWKPPSDIGGFAVDKYELEFSNSTVLDTVAFVDTVLINADRGTEAKFTIDAAANGREYTVRVRAHNSIGWGDWSDSLLVTVALPPMAPTVILQSVDSQTIKVNYSYMDSNEGGKAIFRWLITHNATGEEETIIIDQGTGAYEKVISGFTPGPTNVYAISVIAVNEMGQSKRTRIFHVINVEPLAPRSVAATTYNTTHVLVKWESVVSPRNGGSEVTAYVLSYAIGSDDFAKVEPQTFTVTGSTQFVLLPDFVLGKLYHFWVSASNANGSGPQSTPSQTSWLEFATSPVAVTLLEDATKVKNTKKLKLHLKLYWEPTSGTSNGGFSVSQYNIYWGTTSGVTLSSNKIVVDNWKQDSDGLYTSILCETLIDGGCRDAVPEDTCLPADKCLPAGGSVYLRLNAFNGCVACNQSALSDESREIVMQSRPDPPTGLSVAVLTSRTFDLSWDAPPYTGLVAGGILYYVIAATNDGSTSYTNTENNVTTFTYQCDARTQGSEWSFTVAAQNGLQNDLGKSDISDSKSEFLYFTPSVIQQLTMTADSLTMMRIDWKAPADFGGYPAPTYLLYSGVDPVMENNESILSSETQATIEGPTGKWLYVWVIAKNDKGLSLPVNKTAKLTFKPEAPEEVSAVSCGSTCIRVSWTPVAWAESMPMVGSDVSVFANITYKRKESVGADICVENAGITRCQVDITNFSDDDKGNLFRFSVQVRNENGPGYSSALTTAIGLDWVSTQPRGLSATIVSATSISLAWVIPEDLAGSDIVQYYICVWVTGNGCTEVSDALSTGTNNVTYLVEDLLPGKDYSGTTYFFSVLAYNDFGPSDFSDSVSLELIYSPDAIVGDINATILSSSEIQLDWEKPDTNGRGIEQYSVDYWTEANPSDAKKSVITGLPPVIIQGLEAGQVYYFRIAAVNDKGTAEPVESNSVHLLFNPQPPTDLKVKATSSTAVNLTWVDPTDIGGTDITGYIVMRAENSLFGDAITTSVSYTAQFLDVNGLLTGRRYWFRVYALNEIESETKSSVASVSVFVKNDVCECLSYYPLAPTLRATTVYPKDSIGLTWTEPDDMGGLVFPNPGRTHMIYYVLATEEDNSDFSLLDAESSSITGEVLDTRVSGLKGGNTYHFKLVTYNQLGPGPASHSLTQRLEYEPDKPTLNSVEATSGTSVRVSFHAPIDTGHNPIVLYTIKYAIANEAEQFLTLTTNNATDVEISALSGGSRYMFTVFATNRDTANTALDSPESDPLYLSMEYTPDASENVRITVASSSSLSIEWSAPISNGYTIITGYKVFWGTKSKLDMEGNLGVEATIITITSSVPVKQLLTSDDGIVAGTDYYFQIVAMNTHGNGPRTATVEQGVYFRPGQVSITDFKVLTAMTLKLYWDYPADGAVQVSTYLVYLSTDMNFVTDVDTFSVATNDQSSMSHTITSIKNRALVPGTTYYAKITATNSYGTSDDSDIRETVLLYNPDAPEMIIVIPPTGVTLSGEPNFFSVELKWTEPKQTGGSPITSYTIDYRTDESSQWGQLDSLDGSTKETTIDTSKLVKTLPGDVKWYFRLRAMNEQGYSSYAYVVANVPLTDVPSKTTVSSLAVTSSSTLYVAWDALAADRDGGALVSVVSYKVCTGASQIDAWEVQSCVDVQPKNETEAVPLDTTLTVTAGETVYVFVYAVNEFGMADSASPLSALVVFKPQPPTGLVAVSNEPLVVALKWTAPVDTGGLPLKEYTVVFAADDKFTTRYYLTVKAQHEDVTISSNLVGGGEWYFKVLVENSEGKSGESVSTSVTVMNGVNPNIKTGQSQMVIFYQNVKVKVCDFSNDICRGKFIARLRTELRAIMGISPHRCILETPEYVRRRLLQDDGILSKETIKMTITPAETGSLEPTAEEAVEIFLREWRKLQTDPGSSEFKKFEHSSLISTLLGDEPLVERITTNLEICWDDVSYVLEGHTDNCPEKPAAAVESGSGAVVAIIVVLLILALAAGGGFLWWKNEQAKNTTKKIATAGHEPGVAMTDYNMDPDVTAVPEIDVEEY